VLPRRKVEEKIVEMGSLNKRGYLLVWDLDAVLLLLAGPGHGLPMWSRDVDILCGYNILLKY
jgi:hypothetical protein